MQFPQTGIYTFANKSLKENLFNNQEFLWLGIISFILMTLMFDEGLMLYGEIRCWSLSKIKCCRKLSVMDFQGEDRCEKGFAMFQ